MTERARIHLMPIVMTAAAALLALKTAGFVTHTSYLFATPAAASTAEPPKAEAAPEAKPGDSKTGDSKTGDAKSGAPLTPVAPASETRPIDTKPDPIADMSPSERGLLEALQKRRETLDSRASDLDLRENLLKAAEQRMEERLAELKKLQEQAAAADARKAEVEDVRLKAIVTTYEAMKVKEAARIFDRLDSGVLLEVAARMKPQTMSAILGQMSPETAQKLTVALARRGDAAPAAPAASMELPKIEGRAVGR